MNIYNTSNRIDFTDPVIARSAIVVEEDVNTAHALSKVLASLGYAVSVATSLEQARSLMDEHSPELVVLDVALPVGDGLQLMEDSTSSKFIVVTGDVSQETAIRSLRLKAKDFLLKPIDLEVLRSAVVNSEQHAAGNDKTTIDNRTDFNEPGQAMDDGETAPDGNVNSLPDLVQKLVGNTFWEVEEKLLKATLEHYKGNKISTAKTLGISLKTLYNRLNAYERGS